MGEYSLCPLRRRAVELKLKAERVAWWAGLTGPRYLGTGAGSAVWGAGLRGLEERDEVVGVRGEVDVEGEGEEVEVEVEVRRKAAFSFSRKGMMVVVGVGVWGEWRGRWG